MNKRSFHAGQWLLRNSSANDHAEQERQYVEEQDAKESQVPDNIRAALAPFVPKSEIDQAGGLNKYFIPGWKGESLTSKNVKQFNQILDAFHEEAKSAFLNRSNFNRKLKRSIFEEFIFYAEFKACICAELDDYTSFWQEIHNPDSAYRDSLDEFINIFCFRTAVIYILKIRFISVLMEQTDLEFDLKKLAYPNSFLTSVFQKGGRNELKSKALEQNIYSWFRPSEQNQKQLIQLQKISSKMNVTEIVKNISIKSEKVLKTAYYSHALSHKNFGLFLNSLLINFPLWLNTQDNRAFCGIKTNSQDMEVISCKFGGDYLESLALSHWLAQDANKKERWDQILCPDFKRNAFEAGMYWKLVNELQFLTFLAQIANVKGKEPVSFVSQVAAGHLKNRKNSGLAQKSLLINDLSLNQSTYDRVILNLTEYPKNNSQHYLIGKIQEQAQFMKEDGFLYVLSSKRLFVPSQKAKVESLLKSFKVEGFFDLEEVKGKGEVGSYIYIFSKQKARNLTGKQSCFTFRLNAQLDTFQHYSKLTKLIQDFFISNLGDVPPLFQRSFDQAQFEFFQDAIVKGRLIHSSSKDSSKITHPHFFNNLLKSCLPMDFFFDIQNVSFNKGHSDEDPLFEYHNANCGSEAPYLLIVDRRKKEKCELEIILPSSLESKSYEYGHSMCFYFGLYPKWPNINIDSIRDFFISPIGEQIIDLTFSGELKKVKANLAKLLLPKVFYQYKKPPEHVERGLALLARKPEELLETRPSALKEEFAATERMICEMAKNYPCAALGLLSGFKRSLQKSLDTFGPNEKSSRVNFNNPILKTPLVLSKTYSIYPDNPDVYVEFNNENSLNLIHSPLQKARKKTQIMEGAETVCLELYVGDSVVLSLYSDEDMILFLKFLFDSLIGMPLSQLLQGVAVPRLADLQSILSTFNSLRKTLEEIEGRVPGIFNTLITQSLTYK